MQFLAFLLFIKNLLPSVKSFSKTRLPLKDIIQFSEFDEENSPKVEEEKKALLHTINKIKDLD